MLWKDTLSEQRAYIHLLQKLAETYENMLCKAQFFRRFTGVIFQNVPTYRFLSDDGLFKGFFFLFVYKDYIVREIVQRVNDQLQQVHQRHILAQIQKDYLTFMESDLTCWVNLMLQCEVFESYQSIVTPNESLQASRQRGNYKPGLKGEVANYIMLQKRYVKSFLAAYHRYNNQVSFGTGLMGDNDPGNINAPGHPMRNTMYLVDSDFDTEDEEYGDDIEEIISNQIVNSVPSDADEDSDDPSAQVRALPNSPRKKSRMNNPFQHPFGRSHLHGGALPSQISERRNKKRKELAQSIFADANPFKMNHNLDPFGIKGAPSGLNADPSDAPFSFGSFLDPMKLDLLPKPWKNKPKKRPQQAQFSTTPSEPATPNDIADTKEKKAQKAKRATIEVSADESEDDILGKPKNWAAKGEVDDPELSGDTKLTPENFQEMTLKAF